MHFDVFSCTNIMIIIIISYSFGFSYCQPNISHSKFSWVLKQSLYLWFSRGTVFCAMDILLLDYFPMLGHSDFAPTFPCSGKHPCNRFLRTNSWSPRARKIWSQWCRLGTHWRQGHWSSGPFPSAPRPPHFPISGVSAWHTWGLPVVSTVSISEPPVKYFKYHPCSQATCNSRFAFKIVDPPFQPAPQTTV